MCRRADFFFIIFNLRFTIQGKKTKNNNKYLYGVKFNGLPKPTSSGEIFGCKRHFSKQKQNGHDLWNTFPPPPPELWNCSKPCVLTSSAGFGLGQTRSVFEFLARKNPGTELVSRAGSDPNDVTNLPQRNLSNVTQKKSEYLRYF